MLSVFEEDCSAKAARSKDTELNKLRRREEPKRETCFVLLPRDNFIKSIKRHIFFLYTEYVSCFSVSVQSA